MTLFHSRWRLSKDSKRSTFSSNSEWALSSETAEAGTPEEVVQADLGWDEIAARTSFLPFLGFRIRTNSFPSSYLACIPPRTIFSIPSKPRRLNLSIVLSLFSRFSCQKRLACRFEPDFNFVGGARSQMLDDDDTGLVSLPTCTAHQPPVPTQIQYYKSIWQLTNQPTYLTLKRRAGRLSSSQLPRSRGIFPR